MSNNQAEVSLKEGYYEVALLMFPGCLWNY